MQRPHPYPINLELHGRSVLVVGGGNVARHKITAMLGAGADVTLVATEITEEIKARATVLDRSDLPGSLRLVERPYQSSDIGEHRLVLTCTDNRDVNHQVFTDAEAAGVWCNSADDPANCAWTLPSVVRQGDIQITASTRGRSPALSMWLRRRFEAEFDNRWAELLDLLSDVRAEARSTFGTSELPEWTTALDEGVVDLVLAGETDRARHLLRTTLNLIAEPPANEAIELLTEVPA